MYTTTSKLIGALVLALGLYGAGYWQGTGNVETIIQERIVTKEGETRTVYRDKIITITKIVRPDGTVEERTETKESDKVVDKKKKNSTTETDTTTKPTLAQYRLGISAATSWDELRAKPSYELSAAGRLADLPLWVRGAVNPGLHQISLGLEIEL